MHTSQGRHSRVQYCLVFERGLRIVISQGFGNICGSLHLCEATEQTRENLAGKLLNIEPDTSGIQVYMASARSCMEFTSSHLT